MCLFQMLLVLYMFIVLGMEVTWAFGSVVGGVSRPGIQAAGYIGIIVSVRFDKVDKMGRG